jgi:hypothetical protein
LFFLRGDAESVSLTDAPFGRRRTETRLWVSPATISGRGLEFRAMSPLTRRIASAVAVTAIALGVWWLLDSAAVPALLALREARLPANEGVAAPRIATSSSATSRIRSRPK